MREEKILNKDLDNILYKKLQSDKKLPTNISEELEILVKNTVYSNKKNVVKYSFAKMIAIVCTTILSATGIVYAGKTISEHIWHNPEKTVGFYAEEKYNEISKEDIEKSISKEEAIARAEEILSQFDIDNEKINSAKIESNDQNYDLTWYIKTESGVQIDIDANDGKDFCLYNDNILNSDEIQKYRTTKTEAEKTARKLCSKYGFDLSKYTEVKVESNLCDEKESYIWYVDFYKQYDGIRNPYEKISITFIPEIDKIVYFNYRNKKLEDSTVEVTREQAEKIAIENDKKTGIKYDILNIETELNIVDMNGDAYLRITDYEQYRKQAYVEYPSEKYVKYRTQSHIRKAWTVTITYEIPDEINKFSEDYHSMDEEYTYYIDSQTGEVIGGTDSFHWFNN